MKVNLTSEDMFKLADYLKEYAKRFEECVHTFLDMIAERGIQVAKINEGDFAGCMVYEKVFTNEGEDYKVSIIARDRNLITNAWYASAKSQEVRSYEISPLLMAEFGSGFYAQTHPNVPEAGQGTLNVYGHANDSNGWYWYSDEVKARTGDMIESVSSTGRYKYHSYGNPPSMPLQKAVDEIIKDVEGIARQAFGGLHE